MRREDGPRHRVLGLVVGGAALAPVQSPGCPCDAGGGRYVKPLVQAKGLIAGEADFVEPCQGAIHSGAHALAHLRPVVRVLRPRAI